MDAILSLNVIRGSRTVWMQLTKRNHYTPCFWAALWNETYYRSFLAGTVKGESVRDQRVHALSVKSGRLLETTVENVHFDKNLGMAEITRESAEDFVKRHHPGKFEEFARTNATAEYPVFLDFEDILSGLERDSPVRLDSESLMIALSPHLLLHADLKTPSNENELVPVSPWATKPSKSSGAGQLATRSRDHR